MAWHVFDILQQQSEAHSLSLIKIDLYTDLLTAYRRINLLQNCSCLLSCEEVVLCIRPCA